jgi:hypothetical protein
MAHSFQVEFSSALLEQVFQTLTKQVHDHDMVLLSIVCFLITYIVETGYACFATQFMDELALPKKHDVLLGLLSFFLKRINHPIQITI